VRVTSFVLSDPNRVVLDLEGARLDAKTKLDLDNRVRATQHRPNTVRLVFETGFIAEAPQLEEDVVRELNLEMSAAKTVVIKGEGDEVGVIRLDGGHNEEQVPPKDEPPLKVTIEGPSATMISLPVPGIKNPTFRKTDPLVLEVTVPGVGIQIPENFRLGTEAVASVQSRFEGEDTILTFFLTRPMGAEVWADADGLQIQLLKFNSGNGKLAGKIVVVDPGHGGHDRGCHTDGVSEKELTLKIGKLLAAELSAQGATVIMTRKTDVFVGLNERAAIAVRNKADFFIAVHINSNGKANSTSGTITFYHKNKANSRTLAECLQREIGKVNELPDIGVWSDQRIYKSGFAVLRGSSQIPGVLLELGFMNHYRDRARMVQPDFHQDVAKAVVKGLKVYLGDE
jgi:N-acetylmuramoyl-L-alanine amidase